MTTTIHFKVKKQDSNEYWTGYNSVFSRKGIAYNTLEEVGAAVQAQMKNSKTGIAVWSQTAQVIAFQVKVDSLCSYQLTSTLELTKLYDSMRKTHGVSFLYAFKQLYSRGITDTIKYAAQITPREYADFRSTMKQLGFSSRNYKKIGDWIFFSDDDFTVRIKLLGAHTQFVNMTPYFDECAHHSVSTAVTIEEPVELITDDETEE